MQISHLEGFWSISEMLTEPSEVSLSFLLFSFSLLNSICISQKNLVEEFTVPVAPFLFPVGGPGGRECCNA